MIEPHAHVWNLTETLRFSVNYGLRVKTHLATFGLAYKFDWGNQVVAKY